ncbi:MAG TPA: ATP-binding protein [Cyclobacteriaceae bacterium]|jgi:signal transduction histidine kinase|nr:ATP-binding protein [Cyclobacteriaceae bacterium]
MGQLQEQDIPTLVLLGSVGILLLVGGLGFFLLMYQKRMLKEKQERAMQELNYQNQMIKLQLESQEQERKRIGADLHDSLGSLLWGAKVNVSFIQKSVDQNNATLTSYQELNQILDESIETVRRIAWELTPQAFHYAGLSASVTKLCDRLDGKGIEISVKEENSQLWNDDRALQVFRIIQELISNAIKHSGASQLMVSMKWLNASLNIIVADNGTGLKSEVEKKGVGLWNINQRIKQLDGKISIGNPPTGTGLEISLEIPLVI